MLLVKFRLFLLIDLDGRRAKAANLIAFLHARFLHTAAATHHILRLIIQGNASANPVLALMCMQHFPLAIALNSLPHVPTAGSCLRPFVELT